MRVKYAFCSTILIVLSSNLALAQVGGLQGGAPGGFAPPLPDPAHTTVMPNVDVSNQPVDKVLEQLRSNLPWFHYVIFRQDGARKDQPKLPAMSLDGVTVEQFLKLVTDEYPTIISIKKLDGDKTPLYEVTIVDPNKVPWKDTEEGRAAAAPEPVTKVFPLADIVTRMNGAPDPKKAMDDILSLVQAALDESGGDTRNPPVLKVHPATQTLIFKGSPEKLAVLSQVLETLRPKLDGLTTKLQGELEESQHRLDRSTMELDRTLQSLHQVNEEREKLKLDLVTAQAQLDILRQRQNANTQPSK